MESKSLVRLLSPEHLAHLGTLGMLDCDDSKIQSIPNYMLTFSQLWVLASGANFSRRALR
jgi:hypothetical protein